MFARGRVPHHLRSHGRFSFWVALLHSQSFTPPRGQADVRTSGAGIWRYSWWVLGLAALMAGAAAIGTGSTSFKPQEPARDQPSVVAPAAPRTSATPARAWCHQAGSHD